MIYKYAWKIIWILMISLLVLVGCVYSEPEPEGDGEVLEKTNTLTQELPNKTALSTLIRTATHTPIPPTHTPTLSPRKKSIAEMLDIVDIVEEYFNEKGEYPDSIEELIPEFLEDVPFTNEGFEIEYEKHDLYIYYVEFHPAFNQYCSYLRLEDTWECGFFLPTEAPPATLYPDEDSTATPSE